MTSIQAKNNKSMSCPNITKNVSKNGIVDDMNYDIFEFDQPTMG